MKRSYFAAVCGIGALGMMCAGCGRPQSVRANDGRQPVELVADPNVFAVDDPSQFPLVAADSRTVHDSVDANAVIAADISKTVPVTSMTGGRVVEIHTRLGDDVRKGQLLLTIASNDLASAYADYQKAVADEVLSRRALNRTKDLYEHGAAPMKDVEGADDTEQKALVDLRNTAERIRILGGDVSHPTTVVEVRAPVSGTIVDQQIQTAGGVRSLDNSPSLFTIANLADVWILADVYENNLAQVRLGDFAEVRLNAYPDRVLRARISNIGKILDPATRTAKVRLEMPNPSGILRPGMFASVRFQSQGATSRVVIPASAVLRLHDKDWVFRPLGGNRFRRDEIQGGETASDGLQFVLAGLRPGDRVVSNALQFSTTVEK